MPPHCDTMDGPVVKAAKKALESGNVNLILPFIPKSSEEELKLAFQRTLEVAKAGGEAAELAHRWFFENAVRLHRAGEGAAFEGLKPAGLDPGPAVPRAEAAVEKGDPKEIVEFLQHVVEEELHKRLHHAISLKGYDPDDVDAARKYVSAMLGFEVYSHSVYTALTGEAAHGGEGAGGHHH